MAGSRQFKLDGTDTLKILKGFLIAAAGAGLAYVATTGIPMLEESGVLGAASAALFATVVNAARKFLTDTTEFKS